MHHARTDRRSRRLNITPWRAALFAAAVGITPAAGTAYAQDAAVVTAADKQLIAAGGFFERGLFDMAATEYAGFLAEHPDHVRAIEARYGLALCAYRQQKYEDAAALLPFVIANPKFAQRDEALAVFGHCSLETNKPLRAADAYDDLLTNHAGSIHAETAGINRTQALHQAGKYERALDSATSFIKSFPESGKLDIAYYYQAYAAMETGQRDVAAEACKVIIRRHSDSPKMLDAVLLLGQIYEASGDLDEAEAQYQRLITNAVGPRKAEGHYAMGLAFYRAGRFDHAADRFAIVVDDYADSDYAPDARLQLGLSQLATKHYDLARRTLDACIKLHPRLATEASYWRAQVDLQSGNPKAALTRLTTLSKQDPPPANLAEVRFDIAAAMLASQQFKDAGAAFATFRKQHPDHAMSNDAGYRQAFAAHRDEAYAASASLCELLLKKDMGPLDQPIRELLAENHFLLKKYADAAPVFEKLVATAPAGDRVRYQLRLGQCAYFQRDYEAAAKWLETPAASQANPALASEAAFLRGDAFLQLGQHDQAVAALQQYAATAGNEASAEAKYKLAVAMLQTDAAEPAMVLLRDVSRNEAGGAWADRASLEFGQLLYRQGQLADAQAVLGKLQSTTTLDELKPSTDYLLAWIDFDAGRYDAAATRFAAMAKAWPDHALADDASYQQAAALRDAGKIQPALKQLRQYAGDRPTGQRAGEAAYLIGACLVELGENKAAAAHLASLEKSTLKPPMDLVLYELAWAYRGDEQPSKAAAAYEQLIAKHPKSDRRWPATSELADLYYAEGEHAKSLKLAEQVMKANDADATSKAAGLYRAAWCRVRLGDDEKAAAAFDALATTYPDDPQAPASLFEAGSAFMRQQKWADADQRFASLRKAFPAAELSQSALIKRGEAAAAMGDFDASRRFHEQYLRDHNGQATHLAQFGIGWAEENLKRYRDARRWYAAVIAGHNGSTAARAQFQIGETYFAEGDFAAAARELLKVDIIYAYPQWSAAALLEAGRAFEKLNDRKQAGSSYRQVIERFKDQPEADLARQRLAVLK